MSRGAKGPNLPAEPEVGLDRRPLALPAEYLAAHLKLRPDKLTDPALESCGGKMKGRTGKREEVPGKG